MMENTRDTREKNRFERLTAIKVSSADILNSEYFKVDGWEPNYILTKSGLKISRLNLIATITQAELPTSLHVDDGLGQVQIRTFGEPAIPATLKIGDVVQVIGKPREFNNERYIVLEVIRAIDPRWLKVRKLELKYDIKTTDSKNTSKDSQKDNKPQTVVIEENIVERPFDAILAFIKDRDKGDGVDIEEIINNIKDSERSINDLLKEGEIFEIRPGRVKIL